MSIRKDFEKVLSCETTSCKSNGIIAAVNVTITVIAVPTVRCHKRLGMKTPHRQLISILTYVHKLLGLMLRELVALN